MLIRSQMRFFLTETETLHLTGLRPQGLVDGTQGIPSYHPAELPKIHLNFEQGASEEDTLNRSLSLIESGLRIKVFLCIVPDFRKVLEDLSLEMTYRIRNSGITGHIDKLIDLMQVGTSFEIDEETSPVIGTVSNNYIMRYRL